MSRHTTVLEIVDLDPRKRGCYYASAMAKAILPIPEIVIARRVLEVAMAKQTS